MPPCKKKMRASKNWKMHEIISNNNKNDYSSKTDRLSSLPDTLLISILSLLPLNSAAATSVLSHRWRYLWTQTTRVYIRPWNIRLDNFQNFKKTVNHILFQLTSSKLDAFFLHYPRPYCKLPDQVYMNEVRDCLACFVPWIDLVSQRNPEMINVIFNETYPVPLLDLPPIPMPVPVPVAFLQTQSLVRLHLSANFVLNFPIKDNLLINLPNLKHLRMHLCDSQRHVMDTLFRSCPLLEYLYLSFHLNQHDHFVHISAPNLKDMHIDMDNSSSLSFHTKFVVDAPKLERFMVSGLVPVYDFVTNPCNLQKLTISLRKTDGFRIDDNDFVNARIGLFRGISCARSIALIGEWGIVSLLNFLASIEDMPIYHNLVNLRFNCDDESHADFFHGWRPQLPRCWLANLKIIEVSIKIKKKSNVVHMNFLSDILTSATALEQLRTRVSPLYNGKFSPKPNRLWNEYTFCRELFLRPRSSPTCQIQFSGEMITASSNDFSYDVLTCQILKQDIYPLNNF